MNKPDALTHRTVHELRALLKGGGRIKVDHLKDLAKYAIFQELEWRDKEANIVRGLAHDPEELEESLEAAEEAAEEAEEKLKEANEAHEEKLKELEEEHEKAMIEFAKGGAEITL